MLNGAMKNLFMSLPFFFFLSAERWDRVSDPAEQAAHLPCSPGHDGDSPKPWHHAYACLSFPTWGKLMNHIGLQKFILVNSM